MVFDALLAACECPPGVEIGVVYVVEGGPVMRRPIEHVDQYLPPAVAERRLMCPSARRREGHPLTVWGGELHCASCGCPARLLPAGECIQPTTGR